MAKRKKWIDAGGLHRECLYSQPKRSDNVRQRAAKKKMSSKAQALFNRKSSALKLKLMLAANFNPGDLVIGLDYDDKHLPRDRAEAMKRLRSFRDKLAKQYKAMGLELVMVWCTEHKHGEGRYHHHIVINSTGDDLERLKRLWSFGGVEMKKLRVDREKNYTSLANYMAKEGPEKTSQRSWSYTRSCKHPEVDSCSVSDDTTLQLPKGAMLLEHIKESNQYGSFEFIEYYVNDSRRIRTKRRRRR